MSARATMATGGALRRLVEEKNVRSILLRLSEETAAREFAHRDASEAVKALQAHGFRLGFTGAPPMVDGPAKKLLEMLDSFHPSANPVVESAQLIVADALVGDEPSSFVLNSSSDSPSLLFRQGGCRGEPLELLSSIAKDVLGSDDCLDNSRRQFGPHRVAMTQVFYQSRWSFALVNLKPIVPGHVLVAPKRCVKRFDQLASDEVSDLWSAAQLVGRKLERHYGASSLTFAIQDGPEAGQTVPHVHIHVIPRKAADFPRNDDIYTEIENHERALHVDNETRSARTEAAMADEASSLRGLFH